VSRVEALFSEQCIRYRRLTDLMLAADDLSTNVHVRRAHYAAFLDPKKEALVMVRESVRNGPAALLSWDRDHAGSEREVLTDALQRCGSERFDLLFAP
jgi:hypothetical protein